MSFLIKLIYLLLLKPYVLEYLIVNKLKALRSEFKIEDELISNNGDGALSFRYAKYQSGFPELIILPDRDSRERYKLIYVFFLPLLAVKDSDFRKFNAEYYMIVTLLLIYTLITPIFVKDDLLRHLRTWEDGRFKDYREFYIMEWSFSFPIYPIWDVLYGITYKLFGIWSVKFWEFTSMLIFIVVYTYVTQHLPQHIRALLLIFLIDLIFYRILSAKPSNMIGFLVVLLPYISNFRFLLSLFIGISYYLFFIFLIPYLDFREVRYAFIISLIFWLIWSNFNYFTEIFTFLHYTYLARFYFTIAENMSPILIFSNVAFGVLVFYWLLNNNSRISLIRGLYFLLLNQVRFLDSFVLVLASSIKAPNIPPIYGIVAILSALLFTVNHDLFISNDTLEFLRFNNTKILSMTMGDMFIILFMSNNISIAPAMEIGLTDRELFNMLKNHTIDCEILKSKGIEYVVDRGNIKTRDCLTIDRIHNGIVVWKVEK